MSNVSDKDKLRRSKQPIIFKLWKLQISHNNPTSFKHISSTGKEVINVYWDYDWLFSIVNKRFSIPLYNRTWLQRIFKTNAQHVFIPSRHK